MMRCLCGCGVEIAARTGKGRPSQYATGACRVRAHRASKQGVTCNDNVTIREAPIPAPITKIAPILKWPGAKWRLAPWIVSHFPEHDYYVEPYCGSAGCFFSKPPSEHEVLNDMDSSLINLFRIIRTRGPELAAQIAMTPWSREEYEGIERDYQGTGDEMEDARRFLIRCWQAHGTRLSYTSGWRHKGVHGGSGDTVELWKKLPGRILAVIQRLQHVEIEHRPALDIIARYNAPNVLLYVDPPYVLETRNGKFYSHEMTNADHEALLEALDRHTGPVVLSGYTHPLYEARLAHWQRVSMEASAEHGKKRTEVLWLNRSAATTQQLTMFDDLA